MSSRMNAVEATILKMYNSRFEHFHNMDSINDVKRYAQLPNTELAERLDITESEVAQLRKQEYIQLVCWRDNQGATHYTYDIANINPQKLNDYGTCQLVTIITTINSNAYYPDEYEYQLDIQSTRGYVESVSADGKQCKIVDQRTIALPVARSMVMSWYVPVTTIDRAHRKYSYATHDYYLYHDFARNHFLGDNDRQQRCTLYATVDDMLAYIHLRQQSGDLTAYSIEAILLSSFGETAALKPKLVFEAMLRLQGHDDVIGNFDDFSERMQQLVIPHAEAWNELQIRQNAEAEEQLKESDPFLLSIIPTSITHIDNYGVCALEDARIKCYTDL